MRVDDMLSVQFLTIVKIKEALNHQAHRANNILLAQIQLNDIKEVLKNTRQLVIAG